MGFFKKSDGLDDLAGEIRELVQAAGREASKLGVVKKRLADVEQTFSRALGEEAMTGEGGGVEQARAQVAHCRAEVEEQSKRLGAVRGRLWSVGKVAADAIVEHPPGPLEDEARTGFKTFCPEWTAAAEAWSIALGRRREIERVSGRRLNLPAPEPNAAVSVTDLLPHFVALDQMRKALSQTGVVDLVGEAAGEKAERSKFQDALDKLDAQDRLRRAQARLAAEQEKEATR